MTRLAFFSFALLLASPAMAAWQTPAQAVQMAALAGNEAAPTSMAPATPEFFQVTGDDIGNAVAAEMQKQGFTKPVQATLTPAPAAAVFSADHPLTLVIQGLKIDPEAQLWQGQLHVMSNGATEAVKPVAGRYETIQRIPVLARQLRAGDIIDASDVVFKTLPERQLRKDTVTEATYLIGQSPVRSVSPGRPIRSSEISQPIVISKGQLVEMNYTTPYMSIRTSGEALENGSAGSLIRVKNVKTEKAISARVISAGKVEANTSL